MLNKVVEALYKIEGLPGITVSDIRGFGRKRKEEKTAIINNGIIDFTPKIKIEIVVQDELVEKVINIIQTNSHTGNPGDGKIFVASLDDFYHT